MHDAWLLLDNLETCVCVSRFDTGEILYTNKKAREEFGLKDGGGLLCRELCGEDPHGPCENCPKLFGDVREGSPHIWEAYNPKTKKHYKNIGIVITWDGIKSCMHHFLDLTENRQTAIALEEELENSKHLNDAKSEFLSRMSHEIRTPMNAVIGMTKIAKQSNDASEIKSCLDNIDASAKQLRAIINDIFDVSKIETRTLELVNASFNFNKTMLEVCDEFKKQADAKKQRLTFISDSTINTMYIGDETRLSQVVGNLLSNAVKFTPEEGHITFSARQKERIENTVTVEVSVTDSGIGISRENIVKLFSPFEQLDGSRARKYGGTGLGLVLCKNIVEMMDGEFNVKSEEGKGSSFSFSAKFTVGNEIPADGKEDASMEDGDDAEGEKPGAVQHKPEAFAKEHGPVQETFQASPEPILNLHNLDAFMPFINVKRGLENLKGNSKLYTVLLRSYQKNGFLGMISDSIASGGFKEAVKISQALKNIAASIALDDLRSKMELLEESLHNRGSDSALMTKLKTSEEETKKLIPDLILMLEEGKL